jgi:hypothetical protein
MTTSDPRPWRTLYAAGRGALLLGSLYELLVGAFFSALLLGACAWLVATKAGWLVPPQPVDLPWYVALPLLVVAAVVAWFLGLKSLKGTLLDLFGGRPTWEGVVTSLEDHHVPGQHGGYSAWLLKGGDKLWTIAKTRVPDRYAFEQALRPGSRVRVAYQRGTEEVTEVCVTTPDGAATRG